MAHSSKEQMKVYYDKDCPVCSRFIVSVNKSSQKEQFECHPMQNLSEDDLLSKEFHVITQDGKIYRKFDGILKIGEMYPKWRFVIPVARLPIIYQILSLGYDIFAAHRFGISKVFDRFLATKIILILVTFISFLLSYPLWLSERVYPQVPLFPFLPAVPFPFDYIVFIVMLLLLLLSLVKLTSRRYLIVFSIIFAVYALFDQSRLQPEFYQFVLMSVALSLYPWSDKSGRGRTVMIHICCFIIASLYVYSGLQKANASFITQVFPWFVEPVIRFLPIEMARNILLTGFFIPVIETGIGIALFTKRFRRPAVIVAICMHLFILFSLGPFGHNWNSVVWPWNIAMCCFAFILFWGNKSFTLSSVLSVRQPVSLLIVILCGILPFFSFFNLWDSYLSASLYSGNTQTAQLIVQRREMKSIDPRLAKYITTQNQKYAGIDIGTWSYEEMNVPSYPQTRIFKSITKSLCQKSLIPKDSLVQINGKPNWITGEVFTNDYSCANL
jgi:predicted DCC family thiol-disulfide oxidoreductase YuxK